MSLEPITIQSGQGPYTVDFLPSLEATARRIAELSPKLVLIDARVQELYARELGPTLSGRAVRAFHATEENKSWEGVGDTLRWMQANGASRNTRLMAIGGGITQDVAALAAHVFYRGIDWDFVPTTLLAMSDSCIGAKAGVNVGSFKNQAGAFHAPRSVLLCTDFTRTLEDSEVASGYGEIFKLALTGKGGEFETLDRSVREHGLRSPTLPSLIRQSLLVKQAVIEKDEYEKDLRRILNYGHTFGHALESATQYAVPHGQAVAWGMDLIHWISLRRGLLDSSTFHRFHDWITTHLPARLPRKVSAAELMDGIKRDKKAGAGSVALVLTEGVGKLRIVPTPLDAQLEEDVRTFLEGPKVSVEGARR